MPDYEPVVGMECHAELLTESKMFCGCANHFGGEPNTRCCPVCLGLPGSLPVPNKKAVEHVIKTSLALNCSITTNARFDRKNYFYPDLPKGYQISEYEDPIGARGWMDIEVDGVTKRIHIRRVHLEEDTGKLSHTASNDSEVDLNRAGVPLMEIVTEFPPDIHSSAEARAYLIKLRSILTYLEVCDGKMEQGSLRCEPNVSVKQVGTDVFGTKTEIKNLNSFRAVMRGIDYEVERQIALLNRGKRVLQETRGWNEAKQSTYPQRSKEVEQEYRYFPDPDLMPLLITEEWIQEIRASMPELPDAKKLRFIEQYRIPRDDASQLTETRALAEYYETAAASSDPKMVANWMMGDLSRLLNADGKEITECPVSAPQLAAMVGMIERGDISGKLAKVLIERMYATGEDPDKIAQREGLIVLKDSSVLSAAVDSVFAANASVVSDIIEKGLVNKRGFLVGQIMKATGGKADPADVNRLLDEKLKV